MAQFGEYIGIVWFTVCLNDLKLATNEESIFCQFGTYRRFRLHLKFTNNRNGNTKQKY